MNAFSKRIYNRVCEISYSILHIPSRNSVARSIKEYGNYGIYLLDSYYPRVTYLDLWKDAYTPARTKYGIHIVLGLVGFVTFYEIRAVAKERERIKAEREHQHA